MQSIWKTTRGVKESTSTFWVLVMLFACLGQAQTLKIDIPAQEVYSDNDIRTKTRSVVGGWPPVFSLNNYVQLDASVATVWYGNPTNPSSYYIHDFMTRGYGIDIYGDPNDPLQPFGKLPAIRGDLGTSFTSTNLPYLGGYGGYGQISIWTGLHKYTPPDLYFLYNANATYKFPEAWAWVPNIYKITQWDVDNILNSNYGYLGALIGFTHIETQMGDLDIYQKCEYTIGLSFSSASDQGQRWTFLGNVIKDESEYGPDPGTAANPAGNNGVSTKTATGIHNIGGVPYLVVTVGGEEYFYVYFNEYMTSMAINEQPPNLRISVARAKKADVLRNAVIGNPTVFHKYKGPDPDPRTWTSAELTKAIDPDPNNLYGYWNNDASQPQTLVPGTDLFKNVDVPTGLPHSFDSDADAAFCPSLNKYLITLSMYNYGYLMLYRSSEGILWEQAFTKLDDRSATGTCYQQPHSFFVSRPVVDSKTKDIVEDCHEVGPDFWVYWQENHLCSPYDQPVWGTHLIVEPTIGLVATTPRINLPK
jgi:hypothetical protein